MIIHVEPLELDPILLLMHESNNPLAQHPFNNRHLADAMNRALESIAGTDFAFVRMVEPEETGLSRWRLEWEHYGFGAGSYTAGRGDTPNTIRKALPYHLIPVMRALAGRNLELTRT